MVHITRKVTIPEEELEFSASRSSGPGGRHADKSSTRVMLRFDVANSPSLSPGQKKRILTRLATRVSKEGVLRVVSQRTRSQAANRQAALERFVELLQQALRRAAPRKPTTLPPGAKQGRLEEKRRRSRLKERRSAKVSLEE